MRKSNESLTKAPTSKEISIDDQVPAFLLAETYIPRQNRKNLTVQKAFRDALCGGDKFKKDIQSLQQAFPLAYWKATLFRNKDRRELQKKIFIEWDNFLRRISKKYLSRRSYAHSGYQLNARLNREEITLMDYHQSFYLPCPTLQDPFHVAAEKICFKWGLAEINGREWLSWLVQNWDVSKQKVPPDEPMGLTVPTFPWDVFWHYGQTPEARRCVITLRQGVSQRQAVQLVKELISQLKPTIKRVGAPKVSVKELESLWNYFDQYHIPSKPPHGLLKTIVDEAHNIMQQSSAGLNKRTIQSELRKYRAAKGHKIKEYWPRSK